MRITAELSMYPLTENYIPLIKGFIDRLYSYENIEVITNSTSTQIVGELSTVFEILSKETAITFTDENPCVFVIKLLSTERNIGELYRSNLVKESSQSALCRDYK